MKMKKILAAGLAVMMMGSLALTGCGGSSDESNGGGSEASTGASGPITVVSREDGSGTRGAFVELFGIEEEKDGEKIDMTTPDAKITNSTSESGTYKVVRPFNIAVTEDVSEVAQDFINFIMSSDGQAVVEENGYIPVGDQPAYEGTSPKGKVVVAGSSSVTPVMEKLKEAYAEVNPNAEIEVQQSDSTTGMQSAIDGLCDIGMASRELKDSETSEGLTATVIAQDGIAVIVNNDSGIDELSSDQVKSIYTGEALDWEDVLE